MGTAPNLSLADNLIMKTYRQKPGRPRLVDRHGAPRARRATELKASYEIAAPSIDTEARLLSGGNIQRLILAREIASEPRLMIAVQPTRGLDVGAVEAAHRLLLDQRAAGAAILLISEDLDEVLALCRPRRRHVRGADRRDVEMPRTADVGRDRPADDRRHADEDREHADGTGHGGAA